MGREFSGSNIKAATQKVASTKALQSLCSSIAVDLLSTVIPF
jgi:hypothetical protein